MTDKIKLPEVPEGMKEMAAGAISELQKAGVSPDQIKPDLINNVLYLNVRTNKNPVWAVRVHPDLNMVCELNVGLPTSKISKVVDLFKDDTKKKAKKSDD